MHSKNKPFFLLTFFIVLFSSFLKAACSPAGTSGNDNVSCTGVINSFQYLYGGSDTVTLNGVSDITYNNAYWLDESLGGNPSTDGNDIFIAHDSRFSWVLGFGGDDRFEVYSSAFQNLYADTNPGHGVDQRGNDTIYIENSVSNGWILGGNDNDIITIKDSNVSFVAAGYSDIYGSDYTPFDGNDTIVLDNVDFGEPNYYYTTRPGAVEGGKKDDVIIFKNGGVAYNVTGGHGNDQIIVENNMLFKSCTFLNDIGNNVECGIYGDEPYISESNATTIAKHGDDEIIVHAGDISGIIVDGGHGSDLIEMNTPVKLLDTNISGGDDRSIVDGFVDRLVFNGWVGDINGSQLQNLESIVFANVSEVTFLDDTLSTGYEAGTDTLTDLSYGLILQDGSSWKLKYDFTLDGNLYNNAIVNMQTDGNQPTSTLTIENNYSGDTGIIYIDTVLNDASISVSDKIVINGDAKGTTVLHINNVNGLGGQTPIGDNEGILIVEVQGYSDNYAFKLEDPLPYSGDYEYKLVRGSNGNWYLQSYDTTPIPPVDTIVALDSRLLVNSYNTYSGQLPAPEFSTTCPGPFTYVLKEDIKHGNLILNADNGSYNYEPDANYNGVDSFSYQITSDQCSNSSNIATISISVDCASSQTSDSGDALGTLNIIIMMFFTIVSGLYFARKEEERGEI